MSYNLYYVKRKFSDKKKGRHFDDLFFYITNSYLLLLLLKSINTNLQSLRVSCPTQTKVDFLK